MERNSALGRLHVFRGRLGGEFADEVFGDLCAEALSVQAEGTGTLQAMLTVAQSHQQFAEGRDFYADFGIAESVAEVQVAQRFEVELVGLELRGYIAAERASVVAR